MKIQWIRLLGVFLLLTFSTNSLFADENPRTRKILCGTWNIAEGSMDEVPEEFPYKVPVPGLVDMSSPDFFEVGIESDRREAFWYQRTFTIPGDVPEVAILKIYKAKYGTKVYLNGHVVGEHLPSFTPGYFDLKPYIKGNKETNELIVRVGAHRTSLPRSIPDGWDFEKYKYIPGIYDYVELILTDMPRIVNLQTAPDIENETLRIRAEIESDQDLETMNLDYHINEFSGNLFTKGRKNITNIKANEIKVIDFQVDMPDCHLWSPSDPFLYTLTLITPGDKVTTRFGMRSFRFDAKSGHAILNGKPFIMRGTNVCIYRFFEDEEREGLPWQGSWVYDLHKKFKSMHWNSIRYCIGFPPEFWYDIADTLGILIQDEFPIWSLNEWPEELKADAIAKEYKEWMRERWNHPCVVIWDAQNESITEETGKAIQQVRDLDLSNRPWDNGWGMPQAKTDTLESHPYFFSKSWKKIVPIDMQEFGNGDGVPRVRQNQEGLPNPYIINEYGWLWLNRNGTPTSLTENVYKSLLGEKSEPQERFEIYARYLAAMTEFWRVKRKCAAVMHFCGLGYSRPGGKKRPVAGATSDHFSNVEDLIFETHFERYVKDAFSPYGIMVDIWKEEFKPGEKITIPVITINDFDHEWKGIIRLRITSYRSHSIFMEQSQIHSIKGLGKNKVEFTATLPQEQGKYEIEAELVWPGVDSVSSYRLFSIK